MGKRRKHTAAFKGRKDCPVQNVMVRLRGLRMAPMSSSWAFAHVLC